MADAATRTAAGGADQADRRHRHRDADQGPAPGHGDDHRRPGHRRPARRDRLLHRLRRRTRSASRPRRRSSRPRACCAARSAARPACASPPRSPSGSTSLPETAKHIDELLAVAAAADAEVEAARRGAQPAGEADPYRKPRSSSTTATTPRPAEDPACPTTHRRARRDRAPSGAPAPPTGRASGRCGTRSSRPVTPTPTTRQHLRAVAAVVAGRPARRDLVPAATTGTCVGIYHLSPNQPGAGAHIANGSYMVAAAARGRGIGRALVEHSLARGGRSRVPRHAVQRRGRRPTWARSRCTAGSGSPRSVSCPAGSGTPVGRLRRPAHHVPAAGPAGVRP